MTQYIEIYKTNTKSKSDAERIRESIAALFPHAQAMFDLDDIDSILRIESHREPINDEAVRGIFSQHGLRCERLESYEGTPISLRP